MWSIGIIFLEMILGTNEIFTISNIDNLTPELVDLVLQYDEGDLIDSDIYRLGYNTYFVDFKLFIPWHIEIISILILWFCCLFFLIGIQLFWSCA